jgi:hypothetical protein
VVTLTLLPLFLVLKGAPASVAPVAPIPFPDGKALIRAMEERYRGKWYRTVTFVQTTTLTRPAPHTETWYEAARIPGELRIDIAPIDSGNMILFRNDSVYRFQQQKIVANRALIHPLMVLGFDVYAMDPDRTIAKLAELGFDLSRIREDQWQGRSVYVVGAAAGDSTSAQFWIDRDRLLFVRMLQPLPDGSGRIAETQFNQYQRLGEGWIAVEVVFNIDGQQVTKEAYADVRAETPLSDPLFDPASYVRAGWIR